MGEHETLPAQVKCDRCGRMLNEEEAWQRSRRWVSTAAIQKDGSIVVTSDEQVKCVVWEDAWMCEECMEAELRRRSDSGC